MTTPEPTSLHLPEVDVVAAPGSSFPPEPTVWSQQDEARQSYSYEAKLAKLVALLGNPDYALGGVLFGYCLFIDVKGMIFVAGWNLRQELHLSPVVRYEKGSLCGSIPSTILLADDSSYILGCFMEMDTLLKKSEGFEADVKAGVSRMGLRALSLTDGFTLQSFYDSGAVGNPPQLPTFRKLPPFTNMADHRFYNIVHHRRPQSAWVLATEDGKAHSPVHPLGGMTTAMTFVPFLEGGVEKVRINFGVAVCSTKDNYCRSFGAQMAALRMKMAMDWEPEAFLMDEDIEGQMKVSGAVILDCPHEFFEANADKTLWRLAKGTQVLNRALQAFPLMQALPDFPTEDGMYEWGGDLLELLADPCNEVEEVVPRLVRSLTVHAADVMRRCLKTPPRQEDPESTASALYTLRQIEKVLETPRDAVAVPKALSEG